MAKELEKGKVGVMVASAYLCYGQNFVFFKLKGFKLQGGAEFVIAGL